MGALPGNHAQLLYQPAACLQEMMVTSIRMPPKSTHTHTYTTRKSDWDVHQCWPTQVAWQIIRQVARREVLLQKAPTTITSWTKPNTDIRRFGDIEESHWQYQHIVEAKQIIQQEHIQRLLQSFPSNIKPPKKCLTSKLDATSVFWLTASKCSSHIKPSPHAQPGPMLNTHIQETNQTKTDWRCSSPESEAKAHVPECKIKWVRICWWNSHDTGWYMNQKTHAITIISITIIWYFPPSFNVYKRFFCKGTHHGDQPGHRCLDSHGRVPRIHDCHEGAALPTAELLIATHLSRFAKRSRQQKSGAWIAREAMNKKHMYIYIYSTITIINI